MEAYEIIKALTNCYFDDTPNICNECPLQSDCRKDTKALERQISDLIERQMEKIDALEYDLQLLKQEKSVVEAEAVKEFAKRVEREKTTAISCNTFEYVIRATDLAALVDEYTEGERDE